MQSTSFRVISGIITLLLLVGLGAVVIWTAGNKPTTIVLPTPILPTPVVRASATPTLTPTPTIILGAELLVEGAGFAFQPPAGYTLAVDGHTVNLRASDAGSSAAPTFTLVAGNPSELGIKGQNLDHGFQAYAANFSARNKFDQAGTIEPTEVGGKIAASVELAGGGPDGDQAAQLVMAEPEPGRFFVLLGMAPRTVWQAHVGAEFAALLASVRFLEPQVTATQVTERTPEQTREQTLEQTTPERTPTPPAREMATAVPAQRATPGVIQPGAIANLPAPTPTPPDRFHGEWISFSDGNVMHALAVVSNTIWIATDGGALAWSRGSARPVKFTTTDGLRGNRLTAAINCPLPGLGVMFGSDYGLQVVDPRAGNWKTLDNSNSGMRYGDVSALVCDITNQFLVVGYAVHGIDIYDAAKDTWRHLDRNSGLAANDVHGLAVVGDLDAIWVASEDGITVAAGTDSTFYNADNSPLAAGPIGALVGSADDTVWIGGIGALYRVSGETWTVYDAESVTSGDFPNQLITGLAAAGDGTLWVGAADGTVCHFAPAQRRCVDYFNGAPGMAGAPLSSLALDRNGLVYYTTAGNGYSLYDDSQWRTFEKTDEIIQGNQVKAMAADQDGHLWVATERGIQRLGNDNQPATLYDTAASGVEPPDVRTLFPGAGGGMWVGGLQGAGFFDGTGWTTFTTREGLPSDNVQAIVVDRQGRTWFGTDRGLSIWNGDVFFNLTRDRGLPSDDIRSLVVDGPVVWIGSAGGGLYRFEDNQLQIFNADNIGLPSDNIMVLGVAGDGALLIGTDGGLARLAEGTVTPVTAVPASIITAVAVQDDELWVGTADSGVYYSDGERWDSLTGGDGLPSDHIAALQTIDGAVWFGGQDGGVVRYRP